MEGKKKSKKTLIIVLIVVFLLLLIGLLLFFILKGDDKVTVTFDSDGGTPVETQKIKKGGTITVPESTKEGFVLDGWYKDDQKVTNKTYIFTDTTLKAKWLSEAAKTYTITFDSKGGSEVEKLVVECEKEVKFGEAPTKEGYNFVSWVDKNETPILDGALLSCEDVTLYANWEKKEEKKEEKKYYTVTFDSKGGSKVNPIKVECNKTLTLPVNPTRTGYTFVSWYDKHGKTILTGALLSCEDITLYADWKEEEKETPKKEYKCPSGYTLKDTNRCVMLAEPEKYCDGNWKLVNGECVNPSSPNTKGTRTCPSKTYGGWTGTGTYYEAGRGYCGYEELPSYTGAKTYCENAGGKLAPNNHCYKHIEIDYTITCASNEKMFAAQVIAPGNGGGCYQVTAAKHKCPDGYTNASVYGSCAKIIDATYE